MSEAHPHPLVVRAQQLAASAHQAQRYGDAPYTDHLQAVVAVLERFGEHRPELLAAAWLHDTVEDTALDVETLRAEVGDAVAAMVDAVTDGDGASRAERKARPYRLIPHTPGAVLVKLADRIANVESALRSRPGLLTMYRQEYPTFRSRLRKPGEAEDLWRHLDGLMGDTLY